MKKVYIVTSGHYSEYHIEAVFEKPDKAELFCSCHRGCQIEEYELSDDKIFTQYNYMKVHIKIKNENGNVRTEYGSEFVCAAEEDDDTGMADGEYVFIFNSAIRNLREIDITLYRRMPVNYDADKVNRQLTKMCQDSQVELMYLITEMDCNGIEEKRIAEQCIKEFIKERFTAEALNC